MILYIILLAIVLTIMLAIASFSIASLIDLSMYFEKRPFKHVAFELLFIAFFIAGIICLLKLTLLLIPLIF